MNVRRAYRVLLAGAAVALLPAGAGAQIGIGASLGTNVPVADYGDAAMPGLVVNGFVELGARRAFALRGELFWSRSDIHNPLVRDAGSVRLGSDFGNVTGAVDLVGASADVVLSLGRGALQPYVIGGVGIFHRRVSQDVEGAIDEFRDLRTNDTDTGYNAGLGLRLNVLGLSPFIEARYYSVGTSPERTNFVPVTIGLSF